MLRQIGRIDEAAAVEEQLRDVRPSRTQQELMIQALDEFRRRQYRASLATLSTLWQDNSLPYEAWLLQGQNHQRLGEFAKADLCFSTCLQQQPGAPGGWIHRGINSLDQRQYEEAERDLSQAIRIDPETTLTYLNRALARIGIGHFPEALADLDLAISNGDPPTRAHYLKYQVLSRLGRTQLASEALATFMELQPQDEISWLSRGMAHIRAQQPERALADFQAALELNPESTHAYQNIATVEAEILGHPEVAIDALSEIIHLRPDDAVARVTRGVLHARTGERDKAIEDARAVLDHAPDADLLFRAAGVFALTSKQHEADAVVAMDLLNKAAFRDGRLVWSRLNEDSDLDSLRDRREFKELHQRLKDLGRIRE